MSRRESKEKARLRAAEPRDRFSRPAEQRVESTAWDLNSRKQFIRRYGWLDVISEYIKRCRNDGYDQPWKYLTLPGPNASDIGFFLREGLLQKTIDGRLNVVICDHGIGDEVANKLGPWGGPLAFSSKYLGQELNDPQSEFDKHFPFDVVNLDLCDSIYPPEKEYNLKTLDWIFLKQRGRSFILLLTTNLEYVAQDELLVMLTQNLKSSALFRKAYIDEFGEHQDLATRNPTSFARMLFPKLIARMARSKGYRTLEHFAARYQRTPRNRPAYEMLALSFEFDPIGCDGRSKYLSRFEPIPYSAIRSHLRVDFPHDVENAARVAYDEFIVTLPSRPSHNVTEILKSDSKLDARLDREAKALNQWYQGKVII